MWKAWREENALDIVSKLRVEKINAAYVKIVDGKFKITEPAFSYYEGTLEEHLPKGIDDVLDVPDEWWNQFNVKLRISRKATDGGLDENDHPWSELRKFTIKGINTLKEIIEQGKQAEAKLEKVRKNLSSLNIMTTQEADYEEKALQREMT